MTSRFGMAMAPPQFDHAVARPSGAHFAATVPCGPVRLVVQAQGVRHAVDAALTLHRCESLLCALQAWTGLALEWRWDDTSSPLPKRGSHACADWRLDADCHGSLALPWALLRELPPPSPALAAFLHWPSLPVVLTVSQFGLGDDELGWLEPGGAVVLPESLRPDWHALLRAADEPAHAGVPVALPSPVDARLAARAQQNVAAPGDRADGLQTCEVRLATPAALPADRLAGWHAGEPLTAVGPKADLWHCGADQRPPRALASGRLMPWGEGWALHVETVCHDAAAAG